MAVNHLYGGGPACIVDFGTATTFNAIKRQRGISWRGYRAGYRDCIPRHSFPELPNCPGFDLKRPPSAIGQNTTHAIQSGLIFGYVSLLEGMVKRFKEELGPETKVIATGGLAQLIANETDVIDIIAPWLTPRRSSNNLGDEPLMNNPLSNKNIILGSNRLNCSL